MPSEYNLHSKCLRSRVPSLQLSQLMSTFYSSNHFTVYHTVALGSYKNKVHFCWIICDHDIIKQLI